jgi:hypothetical protein
MNDPDHRGLAPRQDPGIRLATKLWSGTRKIKARIDTTIHAVHQTFGKSIPVGTQYWTLCGRSVTKDGTLQKDSELDHVIRIGIVRPEQFYGVEISPSVYESNSRLETKAHLLYGDFLQVMGEYNNAGNFNPSVVNYDSTSMTDKAATKLARIFEFLSSIPITPIILVANVVLTHRSHIEDMEMFNNNLNNEPLFTNYNDPKVWSADEYYYGYDGTGQKGCTTMGSLIFLKRHG